MLFDIIFERLNPDVVDSFNEVLNKYRSAIETFITKPAIYSESNIAFITEKYTRDRVFESYKKLNGNSFIEKCVEEMSPNKRFSQSQVFL